jgi:S-DNA-T family DNA segregation ATPase FtsK/SpoIIIE
MASITIVSGPNEGDYYPLGKRTVVIGRVEGCTIQIVDELVSRKHVQIRYEGKTDTYFALDMKSANGMSIQGRKIETDTRLTDGDIIEIGNSKLMFTVEEFKDKTSAMEHYRKVGERAKSTLIR